MDKFRGRTAEEWAVIEADEHDGEYRDLYPFGLRQLEFSVEHVLWYEDYAYKKGRRRDRGHRTGKVLQLIDLNSLDGKEVLDIGCGIGQYSVLMAKKGAIVTGVELSPVGVRRAKEVASANDVSSACTFICGDITHVELPDDRFDVVLMHEVYHHAIKYPGLKEMIRKVAKPGAKIILADTMRGAFLIERGRRLVKAVRFWRWLYKHQHEDNLGDVMLTLKDYEEFAEGFSEKQIFTMSYFYMVKQTFLQYHVDKFYVRWFLRFTKLLDDIVLTLFPIMKKGCGEAILFLRN